MGTATQKQFYNQFLGTFLGVYVAAGLGVMLQMAVNQAKDHPEINFQGGFVLFVTGILGAVLYAFYLGKRSHYQTINYQTEGSTGLDIKNILKMLTFISEVSQRPNVGILKSYLQWSDEVFTRTLHFCEENELIEYKGDGPIHNIELTSRGMNFLVDQKKLENEERNSKTMTLATWVIAIATVVNSIPILITILRAAGIF